MEEVETIKYDTPASALALMQIALNTQLLHASIDAKNSCVTICSESEHVWELRNKLHAQSVDALLEDVAVRDFPHNPLFGGPGTLAADAADRPAAYLTYALSTLAELHESVVAILAWDFDAFLDAVLQLQKAGPATRQLIRRLSTKSGRIFGLRVVQSASLKEAEPGTIHVMTSVAGVPIIPGIELQAVSRIYILNILDDGEAGWN